jgi:hypothetical protein
MVATPFIGAGVYGTYRYIVDDIVAGRVLVPKLFYGLLLFACVVIVGPSLWAFAKSARADTTEDRKHYRELMYDWPYAPLAGLVSAIKALPRWRISGDADREPPKQEAAGEDVERTISEYEMTTKDWADAFRAQKTAIADLRRDLQLQSMFTEEMWKRDRGASERRGTQARAGPPDAPGPS